MCYPFPGGGDVAEQVLWGTVNGVLCFAIWRQRTDTTVSVAWSKQLGIEVWSSGRKSELEIEGGWRSWLRSQGRRVRRKREGAQHLTLGKGDGAGVASEVGWRGREGGLR